MRVAIVHDWLTGMRGGERVLEALLDLFPDAEIFTLVHRAGTVSARIEDRPVHTSFIDRLPGGRAFYRYWLPFFPAAVERFDLRGFDLVISSSHAVAKGARPPPGVPHLCYCHTPMRYVWDLYDDYFGPGRAALPVRLAMAPVARRLRHWDVATARRVDAFVANSRHIRDRIRRCYRRDAAVVHPPVDVDRFRPAPERDEFFLVVSALVPYKRIDLAVEAFERLGRPLVVIGEGPELRRLRRAAGPAIRFTGRLSDEAVADHLGRCRAFVLPGLEDFGITAVEAQAAGAPVIAYGAGGVLETVVGAGGGTRRRVARTERRAASDGRSRTRRRGDRRRGSARHATGVFFEEQTPEALVDAVHRFETLEFDPAALGANARRFQPDAFRSGMRAQIARLLDGARGRAGYWKD